MHTQTKQMWQNVSNWWTQVKDILVFHCVAMKFVKFKGWGWGRKKKQESVEDKRREKAGDLKVCFNRFGQGCLWQSLGQGEARGTVTCHETFFFTLASLNFLVPSLCSLPRYWNLLCGPSLSGPKPQYWSLLKRNCLCADKISEGNIELQIGCSTVW